MKTIEQACKAALAAIRREVADADGDEHEVLTAFAEHISSELSDWQMRLHDLKKYTPPHAAKGGSTVTKDDMLKWFAYDDLPEHLRDISQMFWLFACGLCDKIEPGPERTVCLRKLLEAKDAAVRAVVHPAG